MFNLKQNIAVLVFVLISFLTTTACSPSKSGGATDKPPIETDISASWTKVTEHAAYPVGYNYPVFVEQNRMYALHWEGIWQSADGKVWSKITLPSVRHTPYEARYIQFNNAVYAFGQNQGNYVDGIKFSSMIRRTTDFQKWETLAEKSELPDRVFYGSVVFNGKIWLLGGYDGKNYYNDVWNSSDGVRWQRVAEKAAWSPRMVGTVVLFKNRLWIFGGGVIDGDKEINPASQKEVWNSADGVNWTLEKTKTERGGGGTPIVFNDKLWFVGANRNDGKFSNAVTVSDDGATWTAQSAPWSPRGAVAAWIFDNKLYITGGKYSVTENGEIKFIYSNDVWYMTAPQTVALLH